MITGKKVNLRAFEKKDLKIVCSWENNPDVEKFFNDPYPKSLEDEEKWLKRLTEDHEYEAKIFAIEYERRFIGLIYLSKIDWRARKARLSIFIGEESFRGKSLGVDSVRTLVDFAFQNMNLHRIELEVVKDNIPAGRCYQKAGFTVEGEKKDAWFVDGEYYPVLIMSFLNPAQVKS